MNFQHIIIEGMLLPNKLFYKTTHANIAFTKNKLSGKQKE